MEKPETCLILWIISFLFGLAVLLQLSVIFPSVTGSAFAALRGGIFSMVMLSFIGIMKNVSAVFTG